MVAPFLGPLRRWIKRNRPTAKKSHQKISDAQRETRTPVEEVLQNDLPMKDSPVEQSRATITGDDGEAESKNTEASSKALKLLLGIVDLPDTTDAEGTLADAQGDEKQVIDLASLFRTGQTSRTKNDTTQARAFPASQPPMPISLLNTSIETSIMEQLRPRDNTHHFSAPVQYHPQQPGPPMTRMFNNSPAMQHHQLPPWMMPQITHPPPNIHQFRSEPMHLPHPPSMPPNPYPLHHSRHPQGIPLASNGPPGFMPRPPNRDADVLDKKSNPNAQSLLAILKPSQDSHQRSIGPDVVRGAPGPPQEHKQSLLALLKTPGQQSFGRNAADCTNTQHTMSETSGLRPHSAANESDPRDKDAFFLNYLTNAVNNR